MLNTGEDVPIYSAVGEFLGYIPEREARKRIRAGQATVTQKRHTLRLILKPDVVGPVRALSPRDAGGAALSTTYREELYTGSRRDHTNVSSVNAVITLKKLHRGALIPYREDEKFPKRRYNPDRLPTPIFRSLHLAQEWLARRLAQVPA